MHYCSLKAMLFARTDTRTLIAIQVYRKNTSLGTNYKNISRQSL